MEKVPERPIEIEENKTLDYFCRLTNTTLAELSDTLKSGPEGQQVFAVIKKLLHEYESNNPNDPQIQEQGFMVVTGAIDKRNQTAQQLIAVLNSVLGNNDKAA